MTDDALRIARRRLTPVWSPGCWTALIFKAVPAASTDEQDTIVHTPDHYVVAAWAPAEGPNLLLPEAAAIASPDAERALLELARLVPGDAPLFLAGPDRVDAQLAAEVVLAADRNLEPYQRAGLEAFVAHQMQRRADTLRALYTDRDEEFERFRSAALGDGVQE